MIKYSVYDAKQKLGAVIEQAREKPVFITRHNRIATVMISRDLFWRYMKLERDAMNREALSE